VVLVGDVAEIIEVRMRYDDEAALLDVANEKIIMYEYLRCATTLCHPEMKDAVVLPLIFGSRGAVPGETVRILQNLGFVISHIKGMSLNIPRSSLSIMSGYLKY
jgi:hypothetical protein